MTTPLKAVARPWAVERLDPGHIAGGVHLDLWGLSLVDTDPAPLKAFMWIVDHLLNLRGVDASTPVVICDEHQDSSGDQHAVIMALLTQHARVRIFADPMQNIFGDRAVAGGCAPCDWDAFTKQADAFEELAVLTAPPPRS